MSSSNLESRIAIGLSSTEITAADLVALITETECAITEADAAAAMARKNALDITVRPDPGPAREEMLEAQFRAERLRNVLPRLQQRHHEIADREYLASWWARRAVLEPKRDGLAAELQELWSHVERLPDLLRRIAANDAEISGLMQSRPSGVGGDLLSAELVARGLPAYSRDAQPLAKELYLPGLSGGRAWPPRPQLVEVVPPLPHAGADWAQQARAAAEETRRDSARAIEFYNKASEEQERKQSA